MKAEIVGNTKGFKPVSIQLTFETKSELAAWLLMTNNWTVTEDTVGGQLAHNPEFEEYDPMSVDFQALTAGDIWQELLEHLDK
mgnify:FL=1